jgi:hypothetical protein
MKLRMTLAIAALGAFCFGMDCQGTTSEMMPNEIPGVTCFTSYFDEEIKAGCSPPSHLAGPFADPIPGVPDFITIEWGHYNGDDFLADVTFSSHSSSPDRTAEDAAAFSAQTKAGLGNIVLRHEQVTLLSGEVAWLVASRDPTFEIMQVETIVVRNQRLYTVWAIGSGLDDTFDEGYLTGICKTLCVE